MVIVRQTVCVFCECSRPFVNVSSCLTRASFLCFLPEKRFLEFSRFTSCLTFLTFGPICTHILSSRESWDFVRGIYISASRCDWFTQYKRRSCRGLPKWTVFLGPVASGRLRFPWAWRFSIWRTCREFPPASLSAIIPVSFFRMTWTIIFCRCGRKRQFVPDLLSPDTSFVLKKAMIMKAICLRASGDFSSLVIRHLLSEAFEEVRNSSHCSSCMGFLLFAQVSSSWKTLRSACLFILWTWNKESFVASRW